MIRFDELRVADEKPFSAELSPGTRCKIVSSSEHQKNLLLATLAGFREPSEGSYHIFGRSVYPLDEKEHSRLFRRVGLVWSQGGLLSNIRVWENILLPLEYHGNTHADEVEGRVKEMLALLGIVGPDADSLLQATPYTIPAHRKMFIGLIREILMDPEIVIYDSIFDGLGHRAVRGLVEILNEFEKGSGEGSGEGFEKDPRKRTAISLSTDARTIKGMDSDIVIDLRTVHGEH